MFEELDEQFAYLLNRRLGGLSHLVHNCAVAFVELPLPLLRATQLVPSLGDVLLEERYALLVLMSFFRYFLILLLKLNHVVLQFEYLLFLWVADILHFDDAVFEDLIGFLKLLDPSLEAGDRLVFLHNEALHPFMLPCE